MQFLHVGENQKYFILEPTKYSSFMADKSSFFTLKLKS